MCAVALDETKGSFGLDAFIKKVCGEVDLHASTPSGDSARAGVDGVSGDSIGEENDGSTGHLAVQSVLEAVLKGTNGYDARARWVYSACVSGFGFRFLL
jgi:hypothetical protein